jgi:hypothetical protein
MSLSCFTLRFWSHPGGHSGFLSLMHMRHWRGCRTAAQTACAATLQKAPAA